MDKKDYAMKLFGEGCNCSQAILMAYADDYGIDRSIVERLAVAFGGGMSKQGKTCGCLSGALMVIGLEYGSDSTTILANRGNSYNKGKAFIDRFNNHFGATDCRELIKLDLNKQEELEHAVKNVFGSRCRNMVGETVEMLECFGIMSESAKEIYDAGTRRSEE